MTVNLITFASWRYESSRKRLLRSAASFGQFRSWNFSPTDFRRTAVYRLHPAISHAARGAGLWLWKPYFILEVLSQLEDNEFLLYLDAGIEIVASIEPLVALAASGCGVALFTGHERLNRQWTKRDCFVLMGCDEPRYIDSEQIMGGIIVLRKNPLVMKLVSDWLRYATDVRILSDRPNQCGAPNYPDFVEHRHDQSILSNLRIMYGIPGYTDPTQYGDAYRALATTGTDDYGSLLRLHRERKPSWRTAVKLLCTDKARFARGLRLHISQMLGGPDSRE